MNQTTFVRIELPAEENALLEKHQEALKRLMKADHISKASTIRFLISNSTIPTSIPTTDQTIAS